MVKKNIAWLMLGDAAFGGAEKRMATLFQYLVKNDTKFNYYLFISAPRFKILCDAGIIASNKNILILENGKNLNKKNKSICYNFIKIITPIFLKKIFWFIEEWKTHLITKKIILQFYNEYKIDIVHVFNEVAFPAGLIRKKQKSPILVFSYADSTFYFVKKSFLWYHKTYHHALKNADFIDILGNYFLSGLQKKGYCIKNTNFSISPCSFIDYSTTYVKPKKNIIVHVSRLVECKNPLLFIEVAKKIIENYNGEVFFKICGSGELEKQIIATIKKYNLQKYFEVAYCNDVIAVLSESSIFMSLQDFGNYPNQALIEAMACENVVIATNVDDTYKIVPPDCGILVNKNIEEIANKAIDLLNNPEKIKEMGSNARKFIMQNFTIEKYSNYILDIYKKLSNE